MATNDKYARWGHKRVKYDSKNICIQCDELLTPAAYTILAEF